MPGRVEASPGLSLSAPAAAKVLGLGERPPRWPGWFVFKDMQPPSRSALTRPFPAPLSTRRGTLERARPSSLGPGCPPREARAGVCGGSWGVHSYQVWRGGLGLRSVIIHVQIDQDFGCSPYSAGHFPYRQLPESRGRGDRDKARPVSTEKGSRNGLDVGEASTPACKQHPADPARSGQQALCRWSEGQNGTPGPSGSLVTRRTAPTGDAGPLGVTTQRTDGVTESRERKGLSKAT